MRVTATLQSSHTRYRDLTAAEKERIKNLHRPLKISNQNVNRLQAKVDKLIANQSVCLQDNLAADISHIITEVSPVVKDRFPLNSPQCIFWDQQKCYNSLRDKHQMRWHPLVIQFAINLKYLSGTAYQAVHQSGMISLPSECTLSDYTHWVTAHNGTAGVHQAIPVLASGRSSLWTEPVCPLHERDEAQIRSCLQKTYRCSLWLC